MTAKAKSTVDESSTPTSNTVEWILWQHRCGRNIKKDTQWKNTTSEMAHFFAHHDTAANNNSHHDETEVHEEEPSSSHQVFSCDLDHLPFPSQSFFLKNQRGHHDKAPSKHTEYSLFKRGILPNWEDEQCQGELYTKHYFPSELLDQYWQSLVHGVMDDTGSIDDTHICGVRVVDKSHGQHPLYKLELWLDTTDSLVRNQVAKQAMACIPMDDHHRFKLHWREFSLEEAQQEVAATNKKNDEDEASSTLRASSTQSNPVLPEKVAQ